MTPEKVIFVYDNHSIYGNDVNETLQSYSSVFMVLDFVSYWYIQNKLSYDI